jgi:hypothetical protein
LDFFFSFRQKKVIVFLVKNPWDQKNTFFEQKRQKRMGSPWTPTRVSSEPRRFLGRGRARWMRHRRLDVPVQKDGEGS